MAPRASASAASCSPACGRTATWSSRWTWTRGRRSSRPTPPPSTSPITTAADNNAYSFSGQYTLPACGAPFDFTIAGATLTIDVVASSDVPANDIVLKLVHNGNVIKSSDSATSPEEIHYATGAVLDPGT